MGIERLRKGVVDEVGEGMISPFGELTVANKVPQVAWRMDYNINTKLYDTAITTTGGVTATDGQAVLTTGIDTTGSGRLSTKNRLRYLNGVGLEVLFTAVYDTPKADTFQYVGYGDALDGYFIGYNGLNFGVLRRRSGIDYWALESDFNSEDRPQITPQNGNVYRITMQYLGFGFVTFGAEDPNSYRNSKKPEFKDFYVLNYPNTSNHTHILNPTLPLYAYVANSGNNTNVTLKTASAGGFLHGGVEAKVSPLDVPGNYDASTNIANQNNNHVLTISNKATYVGANNRLPVEVKSINLSRGSAGASNSVVRIYKTATTSIPLVYADYDSTNSPIEVSNTTATIVTGDSLRSYTITSNDTHQAIYFGVNELVVYPGEKLHISVQNNQNTGTDFVFTINWNELF